MADLSTGSDIPALAAATNRAEGFRGGFRRVWERGADGAQLQVEVDSFTCADGAALFVNQNGIPEPDVKPFRVTDGISGALGFMSTTRNARGHYRQAIFARVGDAAILVSYFSPSPSTATLQSLAAAAAGHLAAVTAGS